MTMNPISFGLLPFRSMFRCFWNGKSLEDAGGPGLSFAVSGKNNSQGDMNRGRAITEAKVWGENWRGRTLKAVSMDLMACCLDREFPASFAP